MAPSRWSRNFNEFVQACRAYRPSELVPTIARISAALGEPPYADHVKRRCPPWGLAAIARESLLHGNERRDRPITDDGILVLLLKFFDSDIPREPAPGDPGVLVSLVTPILYEQFPWQESIFEELARSHALMIEGLDEVDTKVISEQALAEIFSGVPLGDAIVATFVLQVGANQNGGLYDSSWLDQDNFKDVLELYPRGNIEAAARRLTATQKEFQDDFAKWSHGIKELAKFDYNPLVRTPFVELADGVTVAPAPRLIMRTVTPGGLYYPGLEHYDDAFTTDLGHLFEHYVGRQLRLIEGAEVHPELNYGPRRDKKSVDWFIVLPGLVLMIECKLKRLSLAARAGGPALFPELERAVGRAYGQLERSVEQLAAKTLEFSHIPSDRPLLAIIVSAEPIYGGNAYLVEKYGAKLSAGHLQNVPVAAISARDLEAWVTHGAAIQERLLEVLHDHTIGTALPINDVRLHSDRPNTILRNAWDSYPFPALGNDQGE
jgi:hypothetical protein